MQSIGERLEEARKRKGVTIREASEDTKILGEYLNSFENNNFDISLPEIYVRGFLRSYANFLKISSEKVVADYNATLLSNGKTPKREHRELYGRLELPPTSAADEESTANADSRPPSEPRQSGPSLSERFEDFAARFNIDKQLAAKIGIIAGAATITIAFLIWIISSLISGDASQAEIDNVDQVEAIADAPKDIIKLIARGDVRVTVMQAEPRQILYEGPLAAGESMDIEKTGKILISYDKGSNLIVQKGEDKFGMPSEGKGRSSVD